MQTFLCEKLYKELSFAIFSNSVRAVSVRQIHAKKWEYNEAVHKLFEDFKKVYDSFRREVLYNILIEFGISMKLEGLIKMCLNETYSRVRVGKLLSDVFPVKNGLKQGDTQSPLLFNFALKYTITGVQVN
jgi:hypothetical protein